MDFRQFGLKRQSAVDDNMIRSIEAQLAVTFPHSYLDLVKFNDEPEPKVSVFSYQGHETCISEFFKFTDDKEYPYGILNYQPSVSGVPAQLVPIARDPGDFLICLDRSNSYSVVLYDIEQMIIWPVSQSFDDFLEALRES